MAPRSMTGFGRAERTTPRGRFVVEIRSLNSRFLDVNVRVPSSLASLDGSARDRIGKRLTRGKVDCTVRWEPGENLAPAPQICVPVLESLLEQARSLAASHPEAESIRLGDFVRVPGVIADASSLELTEEVKAALEADALGTIEMALDGLVAAREREGQSLKAALERHLEVVSEGLVAVKETKGSVVERYREKLRQRITELLRGSDAPIDAGRLEMEVAMFADRADISEEVDRLAAHIQHFAEKLNAKEEAVGRALDFLLQEMGREVNTMGSKARDLDIANQVLAMKNALESAKEQVLNAE